MSDASFEDVLMTCGRGAVAPERVRLVPSELLAALRRTGTAHVYADTADIEELRRVLTAFTHFRSRRTPAPRLVTS